jgi:ABC-type transport system involved in multi-copper enzyme maturation permease subunit
MAGMAVGGGGGVTAGVFLALASGIAGGAEAPVDTRPERGVTDLVVPVPPGGAPPVDVVLKREEVQQVVASFSPMTLYSEATRTILDPLRKTTRSLVLMGPLERLSMSRFEGPLPLPQSLLIVAPHLTVLVAVTLVCFAVCYACFMRQEIRST